MGSRRADSVAGGRKWLGDSRGLVWWCVGAVCVGSGVGGCAVQEQVVREKPWFAGLQGVEGAAQAVGLGNEFRSAAFEAAEDQLRVEQADKSVRLVAKNGRHLMIHVYTTLMDMERELFTEQVLSERTKRDFRERGRDPREAFDILLAQEDDIVTMFALMPQGERTPGLLLEPQGEGVFRVRLRDRRVEQLRLVGFDMIMEGGNWKLRWVVPGGG